MVMLWSFADDEYDHAPAACMHAYLLVSNSGWKVKFVSVLSVACGAYP